MRRKRKLGKSAKLKQQASDKILSNAWALLGITKEVCIVKSRRNLVRCRWYQLYRCLPFLSAPGSALRCIWKVTRGSCNVLSTLIILPHPTQLH